MYENLKKVWILLNKSPKFLLSLRLLLSKFNQIKQIMKTQKSNVMVKGFASACLGLTLVTSSCVKKEDVKPIVDNVNFTGVVINPIQEVPFTISSANGLFTGTYEKNSNILTYSITHSGLTPTAMHFHKAKMGVAGPVAKEIPSPYTSGLSKTVTLTDAEEAELLAGMWYVNIHTSTYEAGEIRGQVANDNQAAMANILSGANEVPAVATFANGIVYSFYDKSTKILDYTITFNGLVPTAMHFHKAAAGASGDVV